MKQSITVKEAIYINQPPEVVWDFTQDYRKRKMWDKSILEAVAIQDKPFRIIQIKAKGGLVTHFQYKLEDRPHKSSLAMTNTKSFLITGGGGSWQYLPENNGTLWIQTNTLTLKKGVICTLLKPFIAYQLTKNTKISMNTAKGILEK